MTPPPSPDLNEDGYHGDNDGVSALASSLNPERRHDKNTAKMKTRQANG